MRPTGTSTSERYFLALVPIGMVLHHLAAYTFTSARWRRAFSVLCWGWVMLTAVWLFLLIRGLLGH
jgi:hypothetical protein